MDGKLTLTVVTPERAVVDRVACSEVFLPTETRGEIGILPGHTPLVTLLGVGVVRYKGESAGAVAVRGGFAEISNDNVRVLADTAAIRESVDPAAVASAKQAAERRRVAAQGEEDLAAANAEQAFAEAQEAIRK